MHDSASGRQDAVVVLLREAVTRSPQPALLYQLSEALWMRGEHSEAAQVFRQAYLADPESGLFPPSPGTDPCRLRDRSQSLLDHGAIFSPVIAARAAAAVMLGDAAGARRLVDYDRFLRRRSLMAPAEYDGLDFNAAVRTEIKANLRFYDDGESGRHLATRLSWRNNDVLNDRSPACLALARLVRTEAERYMAELPVDDDHPFIASRPASFDIEAWAIVSGGASYLHPHLHPRAWLSAVYYVTQPAVSTELGSHRGWLRFGLPEAYGLDPNGGWDERRVEPILGSLLMTPGYFLHGISPMGGDDERISIAFDIVPSEIAAGSPRRRQP